MYLTLKSTELKDVKELVPDLIKSKFPFAFEEGEHRDWHQDTRIANAFLNLMHLAFVQKLGWVIELTDITIWKPDGTLDITANKHAHIKLDVYATGLSLESHAASFTIEYKDGKVWMYQITDRTIEYEPTKKNSLRVETKKHPMSFLVTKCHARWDSYYRRGEWAGFDYFYHHGFAEMFNVLLKCKSLNDRMKKNAEVIKDRDNRARANKLTAVIPVQLACELEDIINERYGKHYFVGLKQVVTSTYTKYKLQVGNCLAAALWEIWWDTPRVKDTAKNVFNADNVKNIAGEYMIDPQDNVQMYHGKTNMYCKSRLENVRELVQGKWITDPETLKQLDDEYKYFVSNFNKAPISPVPPLFTSKYSGFREFDADNCSSTLEVQVNYHHGNERAQQWSIEIDTTLPTDVGTMFRTKAYFDGDIETFRRHVNEWLDAEEKAYIAVKDAVATISQQSDYLKEAATRKKDERFVTYGYLLS
jgi:hypothetical protein